MKLNNKFKNLLNIFLIFIIIIFSYINSKNSKLYQGFGNKNTDAKKGNNEDNAKNKAAFLYTENAISK